MTAIRWVLIALELLIGLALTAAGALAGMWDASRPQDSPPPSDWRFFTTMVAYAALYPTAVTLFIGWLGPQPHGGFWLTVFTGVASAVVGGLLSSLGKNAIFPAIGVALPAFCTTLVYNFHWLFPNARLAISVY
jgi:hypothetical protein